MSWWKGELAAAEEPSLQEAQRWEEARPQWGHSLEWTGPVATPQLDFSSYRVTSLLTVQVRSSFLFLLGKNPTYLLIWKVISQHSNFEHSFCVCMSLCVCVWGGGGCAGSSLQASLDVARGLSCLWPGRILVPRPSTELTSPALEGGCLTTGPSGKSPA